MTGAQLISKERKRQKTVLPWTDKHDDQHVHAELARAAICYIRREVIRCRCGVPSDWHWHYTWWNPSDDPVRNLVKAGALIAAEIDRLSRKAGAR